MFPLNPVKDEIYIVANKEWLFNGYGFVLVPDSSLTEESDPIWNSEKHEYAKKAELQDYVPIDILDSTLVDYVKQEEISDIIPQFQKIITQDQFVWYNDYLLIDIGEISHSKKVTVLSLYIYTSKGIIKGTPIVSYPTAKVNSDSFNFTYFYLKDTIGIISKSNDIEKISISFNTSIQNKEVDIQGTLGRNILFEETSENRVHGEFIMDSFHGVYPENTHQKILSIDLPETSGNIVQSFQPYLCSKYECNLVTKPYTNAAVNENYLSNPEILTIGSHYDNTERRVDITSAPDKFLSNTIAVSAGTSKDDTNSLWTSYGYGVEFFESWKREEIDQRYPNKDIYQAIARIITTPDNQGLVYKSNGSGWISLVEVGQKIWIRYSTSNEVEVTVTEIISNSEIRIDQTVTPILEEDSHKYVFTYVTVGARGYYRPQQSPTCGIVAAKFRKIQDKTNANWQVCREAARATASNSTFTLDGTDKIWTTNWDMYRGFGIIDVDLAVEYIHQHYIDNKEYKKSAAYTLPKSNPFLGVDDIERDTFVSKANLEEYVERFSGNTETITLENIAQYDNNKVYLGGNVFISYVNISSPNPIFHDAAIYRSRIDTPYGVSPEDDLYDISTNPTGKWEYQGHRVEIVSNNTSLMYIDTLSELRAVEEMKEGDGVELLVNRGNYVFDAISLAADNYPSIVRPNNIEALLPGRWILKGITVKEAPTNGQQYARKDGGWVAVEAVDASKWEDESATLIRPKDGKKVDASHIEGLEQGGHTILDPAGDAMPTQPALQFGAGFTVTDETGKTVVERDVIDFDDIAPAPAKGKKLAKVKDDGTGLDYTDYGYDEVVQKAQTFNEGTLKKFDVNGNDVDSGLTGESLDIYAISPSLINALTNESNWRDGGGNQIVGGVAFASGIKGQRYYSDEFFYECIADNNWVRTYTGRPVVNIYDNPALTLVFKGYLEDALNWVGKIYVGTAITGVAQGTRHYDNDYVYEFFQTNVPIRYSRD